MRRGNIWTVAGGKDYAGKPSPVVVVQDDDFDGIGSIVVCPFTTDPTDAPLIRVVLQPNDRNGLRSECRIMVDKITSVPRTKLGIRVGTLDPEDLIKLERALVVLLGLGARSPTARDR